MDADPGAGPSDAELMQRLQGGEEAALAPLMERWEVPVKRFIFRLIGNAAEAEDLAQEVFVRIYTKRASYRPGAKFSTWCFAIAANQAKNRLRWWHRRPALSLNAWAEAGGELAGTVAAGNDVLRREQIAAVQSAVAALPVALREALVLFEYEQMSHAEIGETVGATPKAVETRISRAREKLRGSLGRWLSG